MSALSRFLEPPRLRTIDDSDDRRATWLELFFDLVFAVANLGGTSATSRRSPGS